MGKTPPDKPPSSTALGTQPTATLPPAVSTHARSNRPHGSVQAPVRGRRAYALRSQAFARSGTQKVVGKATNQRRNSIASPRIRGARRSVQVQAPVVPQPLTEPGLFNLAEHTTPEQTNMSEDYESAHSEPSSGIPSDVDMGDATFSPGPSFPVDPAHTSLVALAGISNDDYQMLVATAASMVTAHMAAHPAEAGPSNPANREAQAIRDTVTDRLQAAVQSSMQARGAVLRISEPTQDDEHTPAVDVTPSEPVQAAQQPARGRSSSRPASRAVSPAARPATQPTYAAVVNRKQQNKQSLLERYVKSYAPEKRQALTDNIQTAQTSDRPLFGSPNIATNGKQVQEFLGELTNSISAEHGNATARSVRATLHAMLSNGKLFLQPQPTSTQTHAPAALQQHLQPALRNNVASHARQSHKVRFADTLSPASDSEPETINLVQTDDNVHGHDNFAHYGIPEVPGMRRVLHADITTIAKSFPKVDGSGSAESTESQIEALATVAAVWHLNYFSWLVLCLLNFRGAAGQWFADLRQRAAEFPISIQAFISAYKVRFCSQLFFKAQHTRQLFIQGKVLQGKQTVDSYFQKFMRHVHNAGEMSNSEQISWFLHGLKPDLAGMTATDEHGRPWEQMNALLAYARGCELRLKAAASCASQAGVSAATDGGTSSGGNGRGNKQDHPKPTSAGSSPVKKKSKPDSMGPIKGKPEEMSRKWHMPNSLLAEFRRHGCCYNCGGFNHLSSECPNPKRGPNDPLPVLDLSKKPKKPSGSVKSFKKRDDGKGNDK